MHRLYRNGEPALEQWRHLDEWPAVDRHGHFTVPLAVWLNAPDAVPATPVGVRLTAHDDVAALAPSVDRADLIVLVVERFEDGRFLTQVNDLRQQYGYRNEIRARGDVIIDQIAFMSRCGINSFEFSQPVAADAVRRALGAFTLRYQPDASYGFDIRAARRTRLKQQGEVQQ